MSRTVCVACKIPTGLHLQLRDGDGRITASHVLQGASVKGTPDIAAPNALQEHGVGLTTDVDGDFWDAWSQWAEANHYEPYIKGFVFAHERRVNVMAEAKEKVGELTNLEGLRLPTKPSDDQRITDPRLAGIRGDGIEAVKA